jgi:hypothetical protein
MWVNEYETVGGWGTPLRLHHNDSFDVGVPSVAYRAGLRAVVAWTQSTEFGYARILVSYLQPGGGWFQPVFMDQARGPSDYVGVGISGDGVAVVVWRENSGLYGRSLLPNESVWGSETLLAQGGVANSPSMSCGDISGCAAAWVQWSFPTMAVFVNRFNSSSSWAGQEGVFAGPSTNYFNVPMVALWGDGNVVAAAAVYTQNGTAIMATRYLQGAGWGPRIEISGGTDVTGARLAVSASGETIAVWERHEVVNDTYYAHVYASVYQNTTGWGPEQQIDSPREIGMSPRISMNAAGTGLVAWVGDDNSSTAILAQRYLPDSGWERNPWVVYGLANFSQPEIGIEINGGGMVLWSEELGSLGRVRCSVFSPPDQTPPSLEVTSPVDGAVTNASTVMVTGRTEPGASVSVSGMAAMVQTNGSFGVLIALSPGPNNITVEALDPSENSARVTLHLTFNDPVQAALNSTLSALSIANAQVAALAALLSESQSNLSLAQTALNTTLADLNSNRADLTAARAALNSTQADLSGASSNLSAARTELARLEEAAAINQANLAIALGQITALEFLTERLAANLTLLQRALDSANERVNTTSAALNASRADFYHDLAEANAALNSSKANESLTATELSRVKAELAAAEANARAAQSQAMAGTAVGVIGLIVGAIFGRRRKPPVT